MCGQIPQEMAKLKIKSAPPVVTPVKETSKGTEWLYYVVPPLLIIGVFVYCSKRAHRTPAPAQPAVAVAPAQPAQEQPVAVEEEPAPGEQPAADEAGAPGDGAAAEEPAETTGQVEPDADEDFAGKDDSPAEQDQEEQVPEDQTPDEE